MNKELTIKANIDALNAFTAMALDNYNHHNDPIIYKDLHTLGLLKDDNIRYTLCDKDYNEFDGWLLDLTKDYKVISLFIVDGGELLSIQIDTTIEDICDKKDETLDLQIKIDEVLDVLDELRDRKPVCDDLITSKVLQKLLFEILDKEGKIL